MVIDRDISFTFNLIDSCVALESKWRSSPLCTMGWARITTASACIALIAQWRGRGRGGNDVYV